MSIVQTAPPNDRRRDVSLVASALDSYALHQGLPGMNTGIPLCSRTAEHFLRGMIHFCDDSGMSFEELCDRARLSFLRDVDPENFQ
jgi:hypothetical protein